MLIFGDRSELADPRERLAAIGEALAAIGPMPPGIARHAAIASALIDAGQLLQGVADADFDLYGGILPIKPQPDERESLDLRLPEEAIDLGAMQQ